MNNSLIPIIKELERIYEALANNFNLKGEKPIIVIQTKGRQKVLGWHWEDKWQRGEKSINEITICAENLKNSPIETLIHEMVHYSNSLDKIDDCNSQQYHNKAFKTRAELYGLNVEKDGRNGYSNTSLSDKLKDIIEKIKPDYKVFELYRKTNISISTPTKMKKWSCGCTTIRCATMLNAQCLSCNNLFKLEK